MPGGGVFECPAWDEGCGAIWTRQSNARPTRPGTAPARVCPDCRKGASDGAE